MESEGQTTTTSPVASSTTSSTIPAKPSSANKRKSGMSSKLLRELHIDAKPALGGSTRSRQSGGRNNSLQSSTPSQQPPTPPKSESVDMGSPKSPASSRGVEVVAPSVSENPEVQPSPIVVQDSLAQNTPDTSAITPATRTTNKRSITDYFAKSAGMSQSLQDQQPAAKKRKPASPVRMHKSQIRNNPVQKSQAPHDEHMTSTPSPIRVAADTVGAQSTGNDWPSDNAKLASTDIHMEHSLAAAACTSPMRNIKATPSHPIPPNTSSSPSINPLQPSRRRKSSSSSLNTSPPSTDNLDQGQDMARSKHREADAAPDVNSTSELSLSITSQPNVPAVPVFSAGGWRPVNASSNPYGARDFTWGDQLSHAPFAADNNTPAVSGYRYADGRPFVGPEGLRDALSSSSASRAGIGAESEVHPDALTSSSSRRASTSSSRRVSVSSSTQANAAHEADGTSAAVNRDTPLEDDTAETTSGIRIGRRSYPANRRKPRSKSEAERDAAAAPTGGRRRSKRKTVTTTEPRSVLEKYRAMDPEELEPDPNQTPVRGTNFRRSLMSLDDSADVEPTSHDNAVAGSPSRLTAQTAETSHEPVDAKSGQDSASAGISSTPRKTRRSTESALMLPPPTPAATENKTKRLQSLSSTKAAKTKTPAVKFARKKGYVSWDTVSKNWPRYKFHSVEQARLCAANLNTDIPLARASGSKDTFIQKFSRYGFKSASAAADCLAYLQIDGFVPIGEMHPWEIAHKTHPLIPQTVERAAPAPVAAATPPARPNTSAAPPALAPKPATPASATKDKEEKAKAKAEAELKKLRIDGKESLVAAPASSSTATASAASSSRRLSGRKRLHADSTPADDVPAKPTPDKRPRIKIAAPARPQYPPVVLPPLPPGVTRLNGEQFLEFVQNLLAQVPELEVDMTTEEEE